jgi:hypothetical protein
VDVLRPQPVCPAWPSRAQKQICCSEASGPIQRNAGYLRLGCMARDKGRIYEASSFYKDALAVNTDHFG